MKILLYVLLFLTFYPVFNGVLNTFYIDTTHLNSQDHEESHLEHVHEHHPIRHKKKQHKKRKKKQRKNNNGVLKPKRIRYKSQRKRI